MYNEDIKEMLLEELRKCNPSYARCVVDFDRKTVTLPGVDMVCRFQKAPNMLIPADKIESLRTLDKQLQASGAPSSNMLCWQVMDALLTMIKSGSYPDGCTLPEYMIEDYVMPMYEKVVDGIKTFTISSMASSCGKLLKAEAKKKGEESHD